MRAENWRHVDLWVAELLGVPASMLWQPGVTVGLHAGLGDYPGIVVLGRRGGVHVSLPEWAGPSVVDQLVDRPPSDLIDPTFWRAFGPTDDHRVAGPTVHAFTDEQLEAPAQVERIPASDIADWADVVGRHTWEASGFAADVPVAFAVRSGDDIAAAANLTLFRGVPSDVGVLTHPKHRGKGFATRVARAATAYAVRSHDIARYRAELDDAPSRALAGSLGFEDYFEQITVAPR